MNSLEDDVVSIRFQRANRDEVWLLPPSIQEWLPDDHLARFVVEIVESLDLDKITGVYRHGGKPAYCPVMMTALLFYGYATGVHSSRKLEAATHDSVAVRYVTGNLHPDHDTIARFRKRHLPALQELFVQVLSIARTMGMLKLGHVSLDGTKVKANASRHRAMSHLHMERIEAQLKAQVARLLELAEAADEQECALDIPEELGRRQERLAKIAEARKEIEARAAARHAAEQAAYEEKMQERRQKERERGGKLGGRPPKPPVPGPRPRDQISFTDPDSRIMPSSGGFEQAYNAQASVDHGSHLIAHAHVSQRPNDVDEMAPALAALEDVGSPAGIVADTGYFSRANVELCDDRGIEPLIASGRQHHNRPLRERRVPVTEPPADADAVERMKHRMGSAEGERIYAKRKAAVEPVFGIIKRVMGFDQFSLRGIEAVQGEWSLVCTSWNLKRMHRLLLGGHSAA